MSERQDDREENWTDADDVKSRLQSVCRAFRRMFSSSRPVVPLVSSPTVCQEDDKQSRL